MRKTGKFGRNTSDGYPASASTEELISRFREWFLEATQSEPSDPSAMALATAPLEGMPSVRMVLLEGVDERGFVFYTNLGSRKARELAVNPQAALCFHWKSLQRQVRVQGSISPVSEEEVEAYFACRARESCISARASKLPKAMNDRFALERRVAKYAIKFNTGRIPRLRFWSGFRVAPQSIEFWEAKPFRLHKRVAYKLQDSGLWSASVLFP